MVKHGVTANPKQDTQHEIVQFNLGELKALAKEGEKIVFTKDAETSLVKFLEFCEQVHLLTEELKKKIYEAGNEVMPNFKGVEGKRVAFKAMERSYGAKYDANSNADETFMIVKKTVDSKKVDEYVKEMNELPDGIIEREREDKLSLSLELKT